MQAGSWTTCHTPCHLRGHIIFVLNITDGSFIRVQHSPAIPQLIDAPRQDQNVVLISSVPFDGLGRIVRDPGNMVHGLHMNAPDSVLAVYVLILVDMSYGASVSKA